MSRTSGRRGLRREAPILLPASLLLFAMLASVTLLSYRAAVARFANEREQATLKLAVALAESARLSKSDDLGALARWLPAGATLALYDARGALLGSHGFSAGAADAEPASSNSGLAAPLVEALGHRSRRDPAGAQVLRAYAPFERAAQRHLLRLEVPEPALLAQQRSLRILTPVVLGLSCAVTLLAIFFLRALVRPYEELLEKARAVAPPGAHLPGAGAARGSEDDVELLLATFDRALAALRLEAGRGEPLEELAAVERTLGPQLESGLLMFDRDGRLLAANPAAVELLGGDPRTAAHPAASSAAQTLAEHRELATVVSTAIAAGRSIPHASVTIVRAGQRVDLGLTLQALRRGVEGREGAARGDAGFLLLLADITDLSRREAEQRFAAGLAQLGELSAGVAHELRNSLATVQGYLTLAARRELPAAAREEIDEARRETAELARVVDDFLTFARPGSGVVEAVDLAALLARATVDPALGAVPFEFLAPAAPVPPIAGDSHLLQRALRNLLLNAAQATLARAGSTGQPPAPVVVGLHPTAGEVTITIDDSGIGLAASIRDRLFEPFASARPGGAGLGLALARRIVMMHGGTLSLAPREPHGVHAEVCLPFGNNAT